MDRVPRIIDLDLEGDADPDPDRPHRIGGRPMSWIAVAVLTPVCLAAFGGAEQAPSPILSQVGVIPVFSGALPDDSPPVLAAGLQVLGTIPQGLHSCFHRGTLLACRAYSGRTEVWRLNPDMGL